MNLRIIAVPAAFFIMGLFVLAMSGNTAASVFGTTEFIPPDMVQVHAGTFVMGTDAPNALSWIRPAHTVTISGDYYISACEVTFALYDFFCAEIGRKPKSDRGWGRGQRPVMNVNWYEACEFCNWLSAKSGFAPAYIINGQAVVWDRSADGYRLPTECEWEFAARGGIKGKGFAYPGSDILDNVAWTRENSNEKTHPVGEKLPNELGLFDMAGNVWEWCWDWFDLFTAEPQIDPAGPATGPVLFSILGPKYPQASAKIHKGSSIDNAATGFHPTERSFYAPDFTDFSQGFRLARFLSK